MPDFDQLDQCVMLGKLLFFLPPPARAPIAQGLYEMGVRVHPDLATKDVMFTGPPGMGQHRMGRVVDIKTARDGMEVIKQFTPDLYDKMQAATTERQKQQVLAEIRQRHPDLIAHAEKKAEQLAAEQASDAS
jgi:hypothetical protein